LTVGNDCESQERELPADVHVALYRIAQEALNNVVKHAQASHVAVSLHCLPLSIPPATDQMDCEDEGWRVGLSIRDDGLGFDPGSVSPEHLGIGIMRERAASIGARLEIESGPGRGTQVTVTWADAGRESGSQ
jgi:signal transduction histidine kinase